MDHAQNSCSDLQGGPNKLFEKVQQIGNIDVSKDASSYSLLSRWEGMFL